jgi:hypothetical protein
MYILIKCSDFQRFFHKQHPPCQAALLLKSVHAAAHKVLSAHNCSCHRCQYTRQCKRYQRRTTVIICAGESLQNSISTNRTLVSTGLS